MTTLTERAARRMARRALDGLLEPHLSREVDAMWPVLAEDATEAIRETLDAMWTWNVKLYVGDDVEVNEFLGAFARKHGLAPPPAEEQQP